MGLKDDMQIDNIEHNVISNHVYAYLMRETWLAGTKPNVVRVHSIFYHAMDK